MGTILPPLTRGGADTCRRWVGRKQDRSAEGNRSVSKIAVRKVGGP